MSRPLAFLETSLYAGLAVAGVRSPGLVRELAASFADETGRVARDITEQIRASIGELRAVAEPSFWDAVEQSCKANLDAGIALIEGGALPPRGAAPLDATFAARLVALHGVSLASLLRAYRIAHRVVWDEWARGVQALDVSSRERTELLEQGSNLLFDYVDHVAALVTEEYTRTRDASLRDRDQRRLQRIRDLVDGTAADAREVDYDLALVHVGLVASGPDVETSLRSIAGELGARLLSSRVDPETTWAWLGSRELKDQQLRRVAESHAEADQLLALGDLGHGPAGFRASHREALDAYSVGERLGATICHFHDVTVEAFALRDERFARAFVARELGPISAGVDRSEKLRDTLRAYFATAHNASAAAAMLKVHDQTIAYRLRRIEECIGQPVGARRAELEIALRIERMLDAQEAQQGDLPAHATQVTKSDAAQFDRLPETAARTDT